MKLQVRILFAQLPALVVVVLVLVLGGAAVEHLGALGTDVLRENYRSVVAAQRMKESVERLDSAALFHLAGDPERAARLVSEHRHAFEAELRVEEGNITEPGEQEIARSLREGWTRYEAAYDRFFAAEPAEARRQYFEDLLPLFTQVKGDATRILDLNQDAMVHKSEAAAARADAVRTAWLWWCVLGLGAAVGVGAFIGRRLTGPLREMAASAERVGEGHLDVRLPRTRIEELDALALAFNTMAERLRLYRRAADSELSRAREAAQAAIESLADPVLVLTLKGEVRATNGAARRALGLDARTRRLDGCDPDVAAAVEAARATVVSEGCAVLPTDFTGVVVTPGVEGERAFLPHATPINDAVTGELVGVTVLLQDVTRLRRLDELKGNLVHTVAHELRTPLTSLGMALHLVLDERVSGTLAPRVLELVETAREDVARLRALVEDLLDLSRIQEGRVVLRREACEVDAILDDVAEEARPQAAARRVEVRVEPTVGALPVVVDRARLKLALTNLTLNAVRHTPEGTAVTLRARREEGTVRFEVQDAGPGVRPEEQARIFEPFVQGSGAEAGGAGLGLFITREVAQAHGGSVGVADAATGGALFWVELPA